MMKEAGSADCLVVVNGPEDGTEFPIASSPFQIGQDPACTVNIRLDNTVQMVHAQGRSAKGGYRIRCATGAPVYINGKRATLSRSKLLQAGDVLKVGYTELILETSADGLASQGAANVAESDLVWTFRRGFSGIFDSIGKGFSGLLKLPVFALRRWKISVPLILLSLFVFVPPGRQLLLSLYRQIAAFISDLFN